LFRIAQETLANIRHHAKATEIEITLRQYARRVRLSIHDNGDGFDPAAIAADRQGIVGMRERARLLGGTLRVSSRRRAPSGTTVAASVPVPESAG
jgi:signal transduction histidine kinase